MKDKRYNKVITLMQEKKLENMNNNIFLNKGITLISLVITIILLIILAGIVINISLGQNGIFTRAKQAKKQMQIAEYIDKVELSKAQAIIEKTDNIILDDLIKQIYTDKIVEQGSITKLEDNKSAKMVTKEGYIFIVTQNGIEYIGSSIEEATVKEAKLESSIKDGIVTLTINAGIPGETIKSIELYEESQGKIENILIPTGMSKIQKEKLIELPFYEEKDRKYYIKVIGSMTAIESEKVTVEKNTNSIRTAKDLKKFATLVNSGEKFEGKTINQFENIDLSTVCSSTLGSWEPIGYKEGNTAEIYYFSGTYNGNGKIISNIYINEKDRLIQRGLFGLLGYNGKVENLTVQGTITTQQLDVVAGGIVGRSEGTIENCINSVDVNGINTSVGGIVGNNLGIIKNCINKANIYGCLSAGIVAWNQGEYENDKFCTINIKNNIRKTEIINCINEGTITANGYISGGIVGQNLQKIENCKNTGNVTSKAQIETQNIGTGGIVGNTITNIVNCSNTGNIKTNWSWAGGIAGHAGENVKIEKCYNYDATVETATYAAGGIVGRIESGSIENCYNILLENSYIKAGGGNAGGIAGTCFVNLLVKNCYNIGNNIQSITDTLYKGLIIGALQNNETSIENCYYEKGNSLGIVHLDGHTLKLNTAIEKENSDFKLNSQNQNSVAYVLNNYIGSEIWEQDLKLNNGYPHLKENK